MNGAGWDSTIITDNVPSGAPNYFTSMITLGSGSVLKDVQIKQHDSKSTSAYSIILSGSNIRVTGCKFRNCLWSNRIFLVSYANGVIDNNDFEWSSGASPGIHMDGRGSPLGTTAWNEPMRYGQSGMMYWEDNVFHIKHGYSEGIDCERGSSYVFRFNDLYNIGMGGHGCDSVPRSCLMAEIYHNNFLPEPGYSTYMSIKLRGGTGIFFDNSITGIYTNLALTNYRSQGNAWPGCTDPGCCPNCNQLCMGANQPKCDGNSSIDGNTGLHGYPCRDQIGRGTNQELYPVYEWNNKLDGVDIDAWVLHNWGGTPDYLSEHIVENRDFYNGKATAQTSPTSPFSGTTGVGYGTIANRPTTCTAGVAYWATDEGEWNSEHSGADGRLYKCVSTNIWSLYYTPYTYPHPLRLESASQDCGNNIREGSEACDGTDLAGQDCISQGFPGGTLSCDPQCTGFVTISCTSQQTCTSQGYYCCPSSYNCSQPAGGSCGSGACCSSQFYCSQPQYFQPEQLIEAESGTLSGMQAGTSGPDTYVYTVTDYTGSDAFAFDIQAAGRYWMEARVNSRGDGGQNSFFVGLDNEPAQGNVSFAYTFNESEFSSFAWDNVSKWGSGSPQHDPMSWDLSPGIHTFSFYGRESNTWLDQIVLRRIQAHKSDTNQDGCVSMTELTAFISRWQLDSSNPTIRELIEAIGLWKRGGC